MHWLPEGPLAKLHELLRDETSLFVRFLSGGKWALAGRVAIILSGVAIDGLLARLLTPDDMGTYVVILSIVATVIVIAQLGLGVTAVRLLASALKSNDIPFARETIRKVLFWGIFGILLVCFTFAVFSDWLNIRQELTWLALFWIAVFSAQQLLGQIALGFQDVRILALISAKATTGGIVAQISTTILLFLSWLILRRVTLETTMFLVLVGATISTTYGVFAVRRLIVARLKSLRRHKQIDDIPVLRLSIPILIGALVPVAMRQSSIWIVASVDTAESVAVFNAARRLALFANVGLTMINTVLPPFVAEMYSSGESVKLEKLLRRTAAIASIPAIGALIFQILVGEALLGIVYGEFYRAGFTILVILALGNTVQILTGSSGVALNMTGHQNVLTTITVVSSSGTIVGSLFLGSVFGAVGVAVGLSVGWATQEILGMLFARRLLGVWTFLGK